MRKFYICRLPFCGITAGADRKQGGSEQEAGPKHRSGKCLLSADTIDGVEHLIKQVPGRLAVVAVVAGPVFSAISGSTIATTAMLGTLMVPVMLARGYHPTMATGPVMAIGAVDKQGDSDYIASCQDGNRYRVFTNAQGRVLVQKQ